jgi:beta-glucosidase/6-phospho-beta-glucosidase/beta-galactosidase
MITMHYFEQHYLREMLKAMYEDGCKIIGYSPWSLIDNFEWEAGYV